MNDLVHMGRALAAACPGLSGELQLAVIHQKTAGVELCSLGSDGFLSLAKRGLSRAGPGRQLLQTP